MNTIAAWRWPVVTTALLVSLIWMNGWQLWWQKHPPAISTDQVQATLEQLPLSFIENKGQIDPEVAYYVQGSSTAIYFTPSGLTFSLSAPKPKNQSTTSSSAMQGAHHQFKNKSTAENWTLKLDFINANSGVRPQAKALQTGKISYFTGPESAWRTGLATYGELVYTDLWPGIDLIYSGRVNKLKYHLLVKPGADPSVIQFAYRGATGLRLDQGELVVETPVQTLRDAKPVAYQELNGQQVAVAMDVALDDSTRGADAYKYSFRIGNYDRSQPLILDPAILIAGYIGGSGIDEGSGIAVDSVGNSYVTGTTCCTTTLTFPVRVGPDLTLNGRSRDAFVAKVNAAGTSLIYAGFIGGADTERANGIAVDSAGNAYVTGTTNSTQTTFPVRIGPDLTYNGSNNGDAFVAKVNATGTSLVYAGYLGGIDQDEGHGIAVDRGGNAYVTGFTYPSSSGQVTFPTRVGPDLTANGLGEAFVSKVNAAGTGLVYSGFIGGNLSEEGHGIAVDSAGNAYVTGITSSRETTFPVKVGPDLTFNGVNDVFVAKVNAAGTGLVYAGYIGGSSGDSGNGIAVDSAGSAYVTGITNSTQTTFPVRVGPDLTANGANDAFVAKVNAAGTALVYAGYLGGSSSDEGHGIAVDSGRNAYVTGLTRSTQTTFPVRVGPDLTFNSGPFDAFVSKVNAAGTSLAYSGYLGGSGQDEGYGIAVDSGGNAYVTGRTNSTQSTFPVRTGPDLTSNGSYDAFVIKVSP